MNKIKLLLVFFFIFVFVKMTAQREQIQGKITNTTDVEGIHIMNLTSRYNTVTGVYGNFSIAVNKQDTLLISSVNYVSKKVAITPEIVEKGILIITLDELINQLDEVVLGPNLTGNLETDLKSIKTEKQLDFYDVGIPGFRGEPEEKIPNLVGQVITPLSVNLEGLYKYMSGYYKKLKIQRKWEAENNTVATIINFYTPAFFEKGFNIPENRLYDFLLFCIETTEIQNNFKKENYIAVLKIFEQKGMEYTNRLKNVETEKKE
ncbi:MAG: hypothetical protein CMC07_11870 [Flavobacteriaceae bacterium]|nr:hypothetical protein [Flavobacteriaceae bacterium]